MTRDTDRPDKPPTKRQSTGPRSAAGKGRSRCNALRHGLACLTLSPDVSAEVAQLTQALADVMGVDAPVEPLPPDDGLAALAADQDPWRAFGRLRLLAEAQISLARVRAYQSRLSDPIPLLAHVMLNGGRNDIGTQTEIITRFEAAVRAHTAGVAKSRRYEDAALVRRRKALAGLVSYIRNR